MKKIMLLFLCCLLVSLVACSEKKEVTYPEFMEKANEIQNKKWSNGIDGGTIKITGTYNGEFEFYFLNNIYGAGFRGAEDEDLMWLLSDRMFKRAYGFENESAHYRHKIETKYFPGESEYTFFIGKTLEATNGVTTFIFDGKTGLLVEYKDSDVEIVVSWNK